MFVSVFMLLIVGDQTLLFFKTIMDLVSNWNIVHRKIDSKNSRGKKYLQAITKSHNIVTAFKSPAVELNYFEILYVSLCQVPLQNVPDRRMKLIEFLLCSPWKIFSVSSICMGTRACTYTPPPPHPSLPPNPPLSHTHILVVCLLKICNASKGIANH